MFLFILESIGTQELILIGLVALIFLGPRRLPEIARKIGKITADLRNTTSEFRTTWEKEVNFEEEEKALKIDSIDVEVAGQNSISRKKPESSDERIGTPQVKEIRKLESGYSILPSRR